MSYFSQLLSCPSANLFSAHNSISNMTQALQLGYTHRPLVESMLLLYFNNWLPLVGGGVRLSILSFCISSTAVLAPPPEQNKKPSDASSKQARLGTMVSQLRKLRFPLVIRTTYSRRDKAEGKRLKQNWIVGHLLHSFPTLRTSWRVVTCAKHYILWQICSRLWRTYKLFLYMSPDIVIIFS